MINNNVSVKQNKIMYPISMEAEKSDEIKKSVRFNLTSEKLKRLQRTAERILRENQMDKQINSKSDQVLRISNALDRHFYSTFIKHNLVKDTSATEEISFELLYQLYLNACITSNRQRAVNINEALTILQSLFTIERSATGLYITGVKLIKNEPLVSLKTPPDPHREYTVEEVVAAGWFSENNEQGIYRRIKFGSLKAKQISSKRIVILGTAILEALEANNSL